MCASVHRGASGRKTGATFLKQMLSRMSRMTTNLVSKCSVTLASVVAPASGARQGFEGPNYPRHPTEGSGMGATGPFTGGVAATPLRHTRNCGKSHDGDVATPWSATGGSVASAPLRRPISDHDAHHRRSISLSLSKFLGSHA